MNKKLLSVVIGAALAGSMSLAQADVTLYGQIDASIDSVDADAGGDDINMNSNYSAFGIRGFEDLGNGLKAIFQAEFQYDTTGGGDGPLGYGGYGGYGGFGGSSSLTDRDQWLGLAGSFGTVRLGKVFTSYRDHGAMIDPMFRTSFEGRSALLQDPILNGDIAGENGEGLATDTIRFDSADYNGLGFSAHYTFDSTEDDTGNGVTGDPGDEDNDSYGLGGQYKNGNILAYADYITNDNGDNDDAWKVGGSYTMGNFGVYGQYEQGGLLFAGLSDDGANIWHLGGSFTMGNTMLYGAYGQGDNDVSGIGEISSTSWTLAAMHSLSQRTKLYAGFTQVDEDAAGEFDHFGLGVRHSF